MRARPSVVVLTVTVVSVLVVLCYYEINPTVFKRRRLNDAYYGRSRFDPKTIEYKPVINTTPMYHPPLGLTQQQPAYLLNQGWMQGQWEYQTRTAKDSGMAIRNNGIVSDDTPTNTEVNNKESDSKDQLMVQEEPSSRGKKMSANRAAEVNRFQDLMSGRKKIADLDDAELRKKEREREKVKHILSVGNIRYKGDKSYSTLLPEALGTQWASHEISGYDASFSSQCIESLVKHATMNEDDYNFDVILLDYSLSKNLYGFELLLTRLQQRYPSAIFVYIHLWSLHDMLELPDEERQDYGNLRGLQKNQVAMDNTLMALQKHRSDDQHWSLERHNYSTLLGKALRQAMEQMAGEYWKFPIPTTPKIAFDEHLFGPTDLHYLSDNGHLMITNAISQVIRDAVPRRRKGDKTWGDGDNCIIGEPNSV